MKLIDILNRKRPPQPWEEGEKIPWNDPDFSRRMLREHLSQAHDAASRRVDIIDRHVSWIHEQVLDGQPARILDLGCGPGLYANRLAKLGHSCTGIDFSPASVEYARQTAAADGLDAAYTLADIRSAEFGSGIDLVMLLYGEINVFRREDAVAILKKAFDALAPAGRLLLEPHTFEKVEAFGREQSSWFSAQQGLFSDQSHLLLEENFWVPEESAAIYRYYLIDAETGHISTGSSTTQAYTNQEYSALITACGFEDVEFFPALGVSQGAAHKDFFALLAKKPSA